MNKLRFHNFEQELDKEYVDGLITNGIMPRAVICVLHEPTSKFLAVKSKTRGRISGFPTLDLNSILVKETESPEEFVKRRLTKRFNFDGNLIEINRVGLESDKSAFINQLHNAHSPEIHHTQYYPFVGKILISPDSETITTAPSKLINENVVAPQGGDVLYQLIDIYQEMFGIHRRFYQQRVQVDVV